MTKKILSPTALLLAAGCTTQGAALDDYGLADVDAQAKSEEGHPLPDRQDILDSLIDGVVDAVSARHEQKTLAELSYSLPAAAGSASSGPGMCGSTPAISDIKVLDADCAGMNLRWGWEIDVANCEVNGETYNGTMLITYDELQELPPFFPVDMVELQAFAAVDSNANGNNSLRYELRVDDMDSSLKSCGQTLGGEGFRFVSQDSHRRYFADNAVETSRGNGVQHTVHSDIPEMDTQILANGDGVYEIALEDGDRRLVDYSVEGIRTFEGDQWPYQGVISAHVERVGNVDLMFTPQTPVDGTVNVLTALGDTTTTLPMD